MEEAQTLRDSESCKEQAMNSEATKTPAFARSVRAHLCSRFRPSRMNVRRRASAASHSATLSVSKRCLHSSWSSVSSPNPS